METYGARCVASPSNETDCGRAILKQRTPIAPVHWALPYRNAVRSGSQGSGGEIFARVGAQSRVATPAVVGQEAIKQFEVAGDDPDIVIACTVVARTSPAWHFRFSGCNYAADASGVLSR